MSALKVTSGCRFGVFTGKGEGESVPVLDDSGEPIVCASEREAERAVARIRLRRIQAFLKGEMAFEDAMKVPEYYLPARVSVSVTAISLPMPQTGR